VTELTVRPADDAVRERALDVLLGPALGSVVDFTAWSPAPDEYHVASVDGHMRFRRRDNGSGADRIHRWSFEPEVLSGHDPIARQDASHFGDLAEERATPHPDRQANAYPHAFEHLAQVFDHPSAPDIVVQHTAAHYWGDQGGHIGEHGSLGVVQARAPFIASGAGIEPAGLVDRSCRLVDVAPTILTVLGAAPSAEEGDGLLAGQDGTALADLMTGRGADHVVAMLLDGTNANVLYDLAARGKAPNLARLMASGCTYRYGAIASLPTVTLANHTTILTGRHPGHHGILHNAWVDRVTGNQVVTNSPSTWISAMEWLAPGTETVHQALHRGQPGAASVSVNEPCDVGADYSVFELMRSGEPIDRPPPVDDLPDATQRFVRPSKDYRWSSLIDHTAVEQFVGIWSGTYRGRRWDLPEFTWVNFTLTDAAFHEGGPYSEIAATSVADTDARIGRILEAVERSGVWDRTAFFVVADHGMELADSAVTGDWDVALADAGVAVRDEGYGFLYLTGP
jgi:phosphonoacetate hydrolase